MAGKKQSHENSVLNVLRNTTLSGIAQPYIALYTTAPTDTTQGTEATGGNYARQAVTFGAPSGNPASITNSGAVTWSGVTWSGTVTAWAICASGTAGTNDQLYWLGITSKVVNSGDTVQFAISAITVTED